MDSPVDILVATAAGDRVVELARGLSDEIERAGRASTVAVDWLPAPVPGRVPCLMLPHAPFIRWASAEAHIPPLLRRAVVVCTGPLDDATANVLRVARAVLALRPDARQTLALAGVHALPLAAPLVEPAADEPERDLDVVVCEDWTAERWRVLARCARVLDGRRCDLRASYVGGTRAGVLHLPDAPSRRALLRRARVALIVGNGPSLEPLSAIEAAGCGAVVVTDARFDLGPFSAGYDVVRADETALPPVLDALLNDPMREQALRVAARETARRASLALAAEQVLRASDDPPAPPRPRPAPIPGTPEHGPTTEGAPSPTGLGPLIIEMRTQRRRLARLEGSLAPDAHEPRLLTTPAWATADPELSVLIPLHDYEAYIEEACQSALAARDVRLEVVVVDDASNDRGADRVEALLTARPDAVAALVRLPANVGIAGARNHAASVARSPLFLFFDADDALLPHGPARLRDALAADRSAAFAYGLLAVEGPEGPRGLLNAEPWNPDLLREGNYINALALVRAEAYRRVGGYRDDGPLELGWEDYDLWLRMAQAGEHGVQVRELVARYRAHPGSRTASANDVSDDLMTYLRGRYPRVLGGAPA
jgi:Glycosyl transferase family 2